MVKTIFLEMIMIYKMNMEVIIMIMKNQKKKIRPIDLILYFFGKKYIVGMNAKMKIHVQKKIYINYMQ